jgi:hypothetical protein
MFGINKRGIHSPRESPQCMATGRRVVSIGRGTLPPRSGTTYMHTAPIFKSVGYRAVHQGTPGVRGCREEGQRDNLSLCRWHVHMQKDFLAGRRPSSAAPGGP